MKSSRSKPFSGKKKKEQLQLKKFIKNQKSRNDSSDEDIPNEPVSAKPKSTENSRRINLKSEWDVLGSGVANPRQNPDYQTEIDPLPESWRIATFENVYESNSFKLSIPVRPSWDYSLTREELEDSESKYFQSWIKSIYDSIQDRSKLSYFEHNLEVWRQLWRVCEISDAVVIVADIRNPVVHLPPSFCEFVTQKLGKPLVIALTKSDLASSSLRNEWKKVLSDKFPDVRIHFVSTFDISANAKRTKLQKRYTQASGILELLKDLKHFANDSKLSSQWDKIISSVQARMDHESSKIEAESITADSLFTIGFIGQPNVGKSSLINSIFGKKIVSASRTPGHTKHFQTLHLSSGIRVCDCPGLVFPSIIDRNLQILSGLYNIAQVKDPYGPILYLAKRIDLLKLLKIERGEGQAKSVFFLCEEYAKKCGFFTSKAGRPDTYRAANFLLRQVIDGKIVLSWIPSGYDFSSDEVTPTNSDHESETSSEDELEEENSDSVSELEFESKCRFSVLDELSD